MARSRRLFATVLAVLAFGALLGLELANPAGVDSGPTRTLSPVGAMVDTSADSAAAVTVYPAAGTSTASPATQISIRGISPDKIGPVEVRGSRSGRHATTMRPDSDDNGASLYLTPPLEPGEQVTVDTHLDIVGAHRGSYSFRVSRPVEEVAGPDINPTDPSVARHFPSAPDLQPPRLTITDNALGADSENDSGYIFLAPKGGHGQFGPMIMTATNELVWFRPLADGYSAFDFRVQPYQGQRVLTWWQGFVAHGHGRGHGVIYSDSYEQIATVTAGNGYAADLHDFTITAADTALITIYQPVRWNLSSVGGPRHGVVVDAIAQEIDIPTGNVLAEWHALDHVPLSDSYDQVPSGEDDAFDYFHINSLDLSADGQLLVSGRATHTIYDVDLATGRVLWRLGGKRSSFSGSGTVFSSQHDSKWLSPTRISLFDNSAGVGKPTAEHSSGMVVDLDTAAGTATTVARFSTDSVPRASSQGNTQPLPDGGAFIGWGGEPYLSQFDAAGALVWQAELPEHYTSYRAYRFDWTGHPTTTPSVAIVDDGSPVGTAGTTVAMSWNGATEVASWRVLAGPTATDLRPVAGSPATGFESTVTIPGPPPEFMAAQALDAQGAVLALSEPVPVAG